MDKRTNPKRPSWSKKLFTFVSGLAIFLGLLVSIKELMPKQNTSKEEMTVEQFFYYLSIYESHVQNDDSADNEKEEAPLLTKEQEEQVVEILDSVTSVGSDSTNEASYFYVSTDSKIFHVPNCVVGSRHDIKDQVIIRGSAEKIMALGYKPCLVCEPQYWDEDTDDTDSGF